MSERHKVQSLLAAARQTADRRDARAAWARETAAAWRQAHREMDDRLTEAVGRVSEEEFERLCEAEMDKVDAMMAQLRAAVDEEKWPRELYWGCV